MTITVTLPNGYLARDVSLKVARDICPRHWRIVASDGNGWHTTAVTVDGMALPNFRRKSDARAALTRLNPPARIFATPRQSNMRTYVVPGLHGAPVHVVESYA